MLWERELQASVSTAFLFLLENTATKKRKTTCKFPLLVKSLLEKLALVLCFCVMETGFLTNQRAYFLRTVS